MSRHQGLQQLMEAIHTGEADRVAALVHPDFEGIVPPDMSAEPDSYHGPDGVVRYFDLFREALDDLGAQIEWLEDAGDWALTRFRVTGSGRESGIPFDMSAVVAIRMRDGRALRMQGYPSLEEARAALADEPQRS